MEKWIVLLALLAGCGGEGSPGTAPAPAPPDKPVLARKAPESPPLPPSRPAPAATAPPSPVRPETPPLPAAPPSAPADLPPTRVPYVPPPLRLSSDEPELGITNFRLLTMDHLKAYILINGERVTDAPALWGFSRSYVFDPRIPVPEWPPKGAAFVAAERERDSKGAIVSSIELALDGGLYDLSSQARLRKAFPHLDPGEMVLYVDARRDDQSRRGALRLKVLGEDGACYRYTNFSPIQSMEEETLSRFRRAIWFQRDPSE